MKNHTLSILSVSRFTLVAALAFASFLIVTAPDLVSAADVASSGTTSANPSPPAEGKDPFKLFDQKQNKAPTYVSAEKLTVDNIKRVFEYSGDVEVIQADMLLTCKRLVGTYSDDNQITSMTAYQDVMITKGEGIRASGNRADYDGIAKTVILTENPELQQQGSILTADRVKVFLNENRSTAEGNVRVKLGKKA